jgi:hypothetical protein
MKKANLIDNKLRKYKICSKYSKLRVSNKEIDMLIFARILRLILSI